MNPVYQTNTSIEAHMIKNLLWQHDIDAQIHGEHLQGGVGELAAIGAVRVLVEEADTEAARKVIHEWEQANPTEETLYSMRRQHSRVGDMFLGFCVGVASILLILKAYP